jgi:hypothetical protein
MFLLLNYNITSGIAIASYKLTLNECKGSVVEIGCSGQYSMQYALHKPLVAHGSSFDYQSNIPA